MFKLDHGRGLPQEPFWLHLKGFAVVGQQNSYIPSGPEESGEAGLRRAETAVDLDPNQSCDGSSHIASCVLASRYIASHSCQELAHFRRCALLVLRERLKFPCRRARQPQS